MSDPTASIYIVVKIHLYFEIPIVRLCHCFLPRRKWRAAETKTENDDREDIIYSPFGNKSAVWKHFGFGEMGVDINVTDYVK